MEDLKALTTKDHLNPLNVIENSLILKCYLKFLNLYGKMYLVIFEAMWKACIEPPKLRFGLLMKAFQK